VTDVSTYLQKGTGYMHLPMAPEAVITKIGPDCRPTVFLDRDGVLCEDMGYLRNPGGLKILPGVPEALQLLAPSFRLVVVTNQSGIAKGLFNEDDLLAIHQELAKRFSEKQAAIEAYYYCPHHMQGTVPIYTQDCDCRKPKPGLLLRASNDLALSLTGSYMVGDNLTDLQAGRAAGSKSLIVGDNRSKCPDWAVAANDLPEAANIILADHLEYMNSNPKWREMPCGR